MMGESPRTMRAAAIVEPGRAVVEQVRVPVPSSGEVRIRLEGCGVCASNLGPWEGLPWQKYPMGPGVSGHEGWGRIDAVGNGVSPSLLGERVAALSGSAYAEYDVARAEDTVPIPKELDGLPCPGEALGCAWNIFERSRIHAGQTVAIVGIGFLGAIVARLAKAAEARVIAISRRPFARELARDLGADETIPMEDHGAIIEEVRRLTDGRFCDRVVEAVGKQWPLDLAAELTAERGTLVIAGYHQDGARQVNMQLWNWRGIDVVNAHERNPKTYVNGIRHAFEGVRSGLLNMRTLVTHQFALEDLGTALEATKARPDGFLKAVIVP